MPPTVMCVAIQLTTNYGLHYAQTESATRRRLDRRSIGLRPVDNKLSVGGTRPFDMDPTFG